MATNSKTWSIGIRSRLAAGALALTATGLMVVLVQIMAAYSAAGPLVASTAQWAA